ncbi:hypothetical protein [Kineosporia sp. NBRC 101731]|uniref:hypothetical protein n=1 Tax=Kineosporia sp. NBRC 101731 TaxID=3032199 RepID=UPI0024A4620B|nr:hypothetical protein [Kineosporia sp. NBRC 101731]GLY32387.1 hypothetical protein Kisp02_57520 [Kineosporia sp. NBRC 101731]
MTSEYPPVRTGLPGSFGATPLSIRPPQPWDLPAEPEEPEEQLEDEEPLEDDPTGDDSRFTSGGAITGRSETAADAPATSSSISAPRPPVTGDRAVDEAMELVSDSFGADLDFQLQAYESAHQTLQDRLADVES